MKAIRARLFSQNWLVLTVLILLTIGLSAPIYIHRINDPVDSDYGSHIRFAQEFLQTRTLEPATLSHPVLQYILAFLYWVTRSQLGLYPGLTLLQIGVQVFTVLILYFWFGKSSRKYWDWLRAGTALTLTFAAPIVILAVLDQKFYFGYIGLANYHNPTIHLLKPLALLSLIHGIKAIAGEKSTIWPVIMAAFWMILATWIKPNYALAILPALGIGWLVREVQKRSVNRRMILFGFFAPAIVSLLLQWLIAYGYGEPEEGIIFAPFQVEGAFSNWLLLKFILSSLFPLLILIFARKELFNDSVFLVGSTSFVVGLAQNYLLAEGGERFYHGNFRWSGQIVLFLLFAIAVRWFLKKLNSEKPLKLWQRLSGYIVYAAHFAGGIAYYVYCMVSTHYG